MEEVVGRILRTVALMKPVQLVNMSISPSHLYLLDEVRAALGMRPHAKIQRFERFGFSGAFLYRLWRPGQVPYLVKISSRSKIQREYRAASRVASRFDDMVRVDPPVSRGTLKALPYPLIEYDGAGNVVELKGTYEAALRGDRRALRATLAAIEATYAKFVRAHAPVRHAMKPRTYGQEYAEYRRIRSDGMDRLRELYSGHSVPLFAYGRHCVDPRRRLAKLLAAPLRPFYVAAAHGDLHPSNVIFSSSRDPRIVDFARAGLRQHVMKDFITMESSLRFMTFPRHIHPALLGPVDLALNSAWSCERALSNLKSARRSRSAQALRVMVDCVAAVRHACDGALRRHTDALTDGDKRNEYFRCLSIVLSGQQQFETYPLVRVAANIEFLLRKYGDVA